MADNELFGNSEQLNDTISRQAAIELFKDDIAAVNELNNLPSLPDRMIYVQESVNTIMNTCKSDSIKDKAFRNAARMIQNAIDGEAPDFETIEELPSAQQWISCKERLPEVGRSVLLSVGSMYTAEGCLRDDGDWAQFRWTATLRKDRVDAWCPLPEPWKGDTP